MRLTGHTHTPSFTRGFLFGMVLAAGFLPLLAAAQSTADNPTERNFVVYVGLDVAVQSGMEKATVVDSSEKSLTVLREGRREQVAFRDAQFQLKMEPKLSRRQMTIDGLKGEAVYDPRTDPSRNALHEQMLMDSIQAHREQLATGAEYAALEIQRQTEYLAKQDNPSVTQADVQRAQMMAQNASMARHDAQAVPVYSPAARDVVGADDNHAFDSYEVTFRLSAPERRKELLGLLRMQVRAPEAPAVSTAVLKFFTVRNVGPEPRKVTVTQNGLPPGFAVDSYTIHLYEDGQEFPTNISENRMELNAAEAHQFLVLRHAHANQTASLPVTLISELVPADISERLSAIGPETRVELAIDQHGKVTEVRSAYPQDDPQQTVLAAALRDVPFLPALQNGSAVASTGTFTVAEFMR